MPLPTWLRWTGVVIGALCSLLMYWTLSSLGKNLTDTVVTRAEATLVSNGPYRWVRHVDRAVWAAIPGLQGDDGQVHSEDRKVATMPNPKGSLLFVNVSPSEARRRLKGFGHGVRKIQSAGRNQAVLIHTATGRHLSELEAKFSDVGFSVSVR